MAEIELDFDGTVVEHAYPEIGLPNPGAIEVILKLQKKGHKIILNTLRANFKNGSLPVSFSVLCGLSGNNLIRTSLGTLCHDHCFELSPKNSLKFHFKKSKFSNIEIFNISL